MRTGRTTPRLALPHRLTGRRAAVARPTSRRRTKRVQVPRLIIHIIIATATPQEGASSSPSRPPRRTLARPVFTRAGAWKRIIIIIIISSSTTRRRASRTVLPVTAATTATSTGGSRDVPPRRQPPTTPIFILSASNTSSIPKQRHTQEAPQVGPRLRRACSSSSSSRRHSSKIATSHNSTTTPARISAAPTVADGHVCEGVRHGVTTRDLSRFEAEPLFLGEHAVPCGEQATVLQGHGGNTYVLTPCCTVSVSVGLLPVT
jgi:hypothetical protein